MRSYEIKLDDLTGPKIAELLEDHLREMHEHSPPESVHALDLDTLRKPEITFWSIWSGEVLVGCGALKELSPKHAEIKSMRTSSNYARQGVGARMLRHLMHEAEARGYRRLSLETGSMAYFDPARAFYRAFGFQICGPFAQYCEDPNSVFMTKELCP